MGQVPNSYRMQHCISRRRPRLSRSAQCQGGSTIELTSIGSDGLINVDPPTSSRESYSHSYCSCEQNRSTTCPVHQEPPTDELLLSQSYSRWNGTGNVEHGVHTGHQDGISTDPSCLCTTYQRGLEVRSVIAYAQIQGLALSAI